jgi:hypothetical protein
MDITPTTIPLPCHRRQGYSEQELAYQIACYKQFLVVPYQCPHCGLYHLLFVRD